MNPYYADDFCTIYNADCRDVLSAFPDVDAVITDPPYGIAINVRHGRNWREPARPQCVLGDEDEFDPTHLLGYPNLLLWGANNFAHRLPERGRWLVWDKRDGTGSNAQADCEIAWAVGTRGTAARVFRLMWNGAVRDAERDQARVHPTQKPVSLMQWCIGFYPHASVILDPYMGSGTTLRAAKNLGLRAIGIEIDEAHCESAVRRLAQEVLPLEVP
jgi:site-specific DNA-methyltransferase (adenine-specific)